MDFLSKIAAERDKKIEEELVRIQDEQREADAATARRTEIVQQRVEEFAISLETECLKLGAIGGAPFYLIGGVVFVVRPFGLIDESKGQSTIRKDVLWQHSVAIVGIDITERVIEANRGCLAFLSFDNIRKAVNENPNCEFGHEKVLKSLNFR